MCAWVIYKYERKKNLITTFKCPPKRKCKKTITTTERQLNGCDMPLFICVSFFIIFDSSFWVSVRVCVRRRESNQMGEYLDRLIIMNSMWIKGQYCCAIAVTYFYCYENFRILFLLLSCALLSRSQRPKMHAACSIALIGINDTTAINFHKIHTHTQSH